MIPLILGGLAVLGGLGGVGGMMSASDKKKEAQQIAEHAHRRYKDTVVEFELLTEETNSKIESMGKIKLEIQKNTIGRFVSIYEKFGKIKKQQSIQNEDYSLNITQEEMKAWQQESIKAADLLSGGAESLAAGAATAMGVYGTTMALGTASTGTAISTLSGAAATNATLAALGGGSLATGGLGMAGGAAVLGGLVAGPALLITGWMMDSAADKAVTEAREYSTKIDVAIEKLEQQKYLLNTLQIRAVEFEGVLNNLDQRLKGMLDKLEKYIPALKNRDWYFSSTILILSSISYAFGLIEWMKFLGLLLLIGSGNYLVYRFFPQQRANILNILEFQIIRISKILIFLRNQLKLIFSKLIVYVQQLLSRFNQKFMLDEIQTSLQQKFMLDKINKYIPLLPNKYWYMMIFVFIYTAIGIIFGFLFFSWILLVVAAEYLFYKFWPREEELREEAEVQLYNTIIIAKTLKSVLELPLLGKDGQLSPKIDSVLLDAKQVMDHQDIG